MLSGSSLRGEDYSSVQELKASPMTKAVLQGKGKLLSPDGEESTCPSDSAPSASLHFQKHFIICEKSFHILGANYINVFVVHDSSLLTFFFWKR